MPYQGLQNLGNSLKASGSNGCKNRNIRPTLIVTKVDKIAGWPNPNNKLQRDFAESVDQLMSKYTDLWRTGKTNRTIVTGPPRIDYQGPWTEGPGVNIGGQDGDKSIATVKLASSIDDLVGEEKLQKGRVLSTLKVALIRSCRDGYGRTITSTLVE